MFMENLLQLSNRESRVNLAGIWSEDQDRLNSAKAFSKTFETEPEFYSDIAEFYSDAESLQNVMVLDPLNWIETTQSGQHRIPHIKSHPLEIKESTENHIKTENRFIPELVFDNNPAAIRLRELMEKHDYTRLTVHSVSSQGLKHVFKKSMFFDQRGDVLSDSIKDSLFLVNFLTGGTEFNQESVDSSFFLPRGVDSSDLFHLTGGKADSLENAKLSETELSLREEEKTVEIDASWIGASEAQEELDTKIESEFGDELVESQVLRAGDRDLIRDEAGFFVVLHADHRYLADLKHQRLYDLDSSRKFHLPGREFPPEVESVREIIRQEEENKPRNPREQTVQGIFQEEFKLRQLVHNQDMDFQEKLAEGRRKIRKNMLREAYQE